MDKNTAELLQEMIDIKKNTRSAIENKGVSIVGGMKTYPTSIGEISQVFAGTEIDFTRAGWLQSESDESNRKESEDIEGALKLANYMFRNYGDFSKWERNYASVGVQPTRWNELVIAPKMYNLTGNMNELFHGCTRLKYVPILNTSSVTSMRGLFWDCGSLTTIPFLDTSSVTDMSDMFIDCLALTTIPFLDTSSVTNMLYMFLGCNSLTTIPLLDTSNVKSKSALYSAFDACYRLTYLGGFKNLKVSIDLGSSKILAVGSVMNVFNNLYDWVANPRELDQSEWDPNPSIKLHSDVLSQLTGDQIAIATNKGWTLK